MPGFLLDSDVIVSYLRGHEETVGLVNRLGDEGELGCSVASVFEVQMGLKAEEEEETEGFFATLQTYVIDVEIAKQAGMTGRRLRGRGITVDDLDLMIGMTATVYGLTLVTFNPKHYPMEEVKIYLNSR